MGSCQYAEIIGLGGYVPPRVVTNHDLALMTETSDEWIRSRTGIEQRRFASESQGTSDLALSAAQNALHDAKIESQDIDLIVAATTTPDYYMPGMGVLLQTKLGCRPIPAIDLRAQCSGFAWALTTAHAYSHNPQYGTILVVGADLQSRVLDFSMAGRNTAVLFGDGAGACVIRTITSSSKQPHPSCLIDHVMGSDGSGCSTLYLPRPGFAQDQSCFIHAQDIKDKKTIPHMDGQQVFKHATTHMEQTVRTLLDRHNLHINDIALIIPHQANRRINDMLQDRLQIEDRKMVHVIHKYGNTTSATLPLAMLEAVEDGRLKKGSLIITTAFGSGYTWGGNLIRW